MRWLCFPPSFSEMLLKLISFVYLSVCCTDKGLRTTDPGSNLLKIL